MSRLVMVRDEAPFLGVSYKWFNVKNINSVSFNFRASP